MTPLSANREQLRFMNREDPNARTNGLAKRGTPTAARLAQSKIEERIASSGLRGVRLPSHIAAALSTLALGSHMGAIASSRRFMTEGRVR